MVKQNKVERELCYCNRCGYEWLAQLGKKPAHCAKCNSAYWDKPRVRPIRIVNESNNKPS